MAKEIQPAQVFEDVLAAAAKMPGVHIDRESFLRSSLKKYCDDATIEKAIKESPAAAGIPLVVNRRPSGEQQNCFLLKGSIFYDSQLLSLFRLPALSLCRLR